MAARSHDRAPTLDRLSERPHAQHFRGITRRRVDAFDETLSQSLFEARVDDTEHVDMAVWHAPGRSKPTFEQAVRASGYGPLKKGDRFGPSWTNHWVRVRLTTPKDWLKKERVQFEFDPGCEGLIYNSEGLPLQGLTGGFDGNRRVDILLSEKMRKNAITLYIEVTANGMFGIDPPNRPDSDNRYFTLNSADIVVCRMDAWRLYWDYRAVTDIMRVVPENRPMSSQALSIANEIANTFDAGDLERTIPICRKLCERLFGEGWDAKGADLYKDDFTAKGDQPQVWAVSNCHIDTAWLWPFSATQQKIARSWSSQCDLMDRYPEHTFVGSQAQQFKWLEKLYPKLFSVVRSKIEEGRFMPIGGSWVEMDTNLPSGEALCRQFLYGQRYFKSRFGSYCKTHWLPDTLCVINRSDGAETTSGYSPQLPQLVRLAGMDYFFTQKLSWSQFNDFPLTTFRWVGLDGSQVLTHMTPVDTYTAQAGAGDVHNAVHRHKNLEQDDKGLLPFGNGDGGGGALAHMLESLRRLRAAADTGRDLPKVNMGKSVDQFFAAIERDTDGGRTLNTWNGELYLELHRGTYTSHGSIKRHNRKLEILLHDIELVATLASLPSSAATTSGRKHHGPSAYRYPKDKLDALWEDVLLCQFHDVLPGSAINMVYGDAERLYANVWSKGAALLEDAFAALLPHSEACPIDDARDSDRFAYTAFNTLDIPRREIVSIPTGAMKPSLQPHSADSAATSSFAIIDIPAHGHVDLGSPAAQLQLVPNRRPVTVRQLSKDGEHYFIISNAFLDVSVSSGGRITSIFDHKQQREIIEKDQSAGFIIFEDRPLDWDAWDVDVFHLEKSESLSASSVKLKDAGPLRASLECIMKIGADTVVTYTISVDAIAASTSTDALSLVRIDVLADWHERHRFLKWEIPTRITSQTASFETQFGHIERPTIRNTSWDRARFEVVGHRFADLSEWGYGVALLNDCKYGYAAEGNLLRISLLRGPTYPDPEQDQGQHSFSLAVYPHRHHFMASDVPAVARAFNSPLHVRRSPKSTPSSIAGLSRYFRIENETSVVLDTIKRGEDDDFLSASSTAPSTVILRFYESMGGSSSVVVNLGVKVAKAGLVDILERPVAPLQDVPDFAQLEPGQAGICRGSVEDGEPIKIMMHFRAFEVKTVKLVLAGGSSKTLDDNWIAV